MPLRQLFFHDSTLAIQAVSWILFTTAALKDQLAKNEKLRSSIRDNRKFGYFALVLYTLFAIIAIWFPLAIAIVTTITWIFWLVWGVRLKHE